MKIKYIIYILALSAFAPLRGQTLTEEVVIDREITPDEKVAVRPSWVLPTMLTPGVKARPLAFSEYIGSAEITRSITPLQPVAWGDSVMRVPYRGYVTAGYFPVYNTNIAAGYRFVRNTRSDVGACVAFDGSSWDGWNESRSKFGQNKLTAGFDGKFVFTSGTLHFDLNYAWSETTTSNIPGYYDRGGQSINMVDVVAGWKQTHFSRIGFDLSAKFGYGGFTKGKTDELKVFNEYTSNEFRFNALNDMTFGADLTLRFKLDKSSEFAVGAGADFRYVNRFHYLTPALFVDDAEESIMEYAGVLPQTLGSQTMGVIAIRPAYRFNGNNLHGQLGVRVDLNTGGTQKDTHIAPDVDIQWNPSPFFAVRLRATGGDVLNTNSELWQRNPWMTGTIAFERSNVEADVDLSFTIGSYKGFWLMPHGGWSSVSNWLSPVLLEGVNTWSPMNEFNGFNYGVEIGYSWKSYLTLVGHAEGATKNKYYRWQDNAEWAFDIMAKIRPVGKLQIELGYVTRLNRSGYALAAVPGTNDAACYVAEEVPLGDTSNLFIGGEYEIMPSLSVFVKAENLLNRTWQVTNNVRSAGIRGLLGATYQF